MADFYLIRLKKLTENALKLVKYHCMVGSGLIHIHQYTNPQDNPNCYSGWLKHSIFSCMLTELCAFSALTLLVGRQEGHPT